MTLQNAAAFQQIAASTLGLRTVYPVRDASDGLPLTYLDSTASTKMIGPVHETWTRALSHYANTHSRAYLPARISTHFYERAHETVMRFVNADPATHTAVFVGQGATGAINRLARSLFKGGNDWEKSVVLVTEMEHHANLLPWRKHAPKTKVIPVSPVHGTLDLRALETALQRHSGNVRLLAVTGVSNVTGIVNDIPTITAMAHHYGAEVLVDAAQAAPHLPIDMRGDGIDFLVFSGHKIYAPGSPGVLVVPKASLPAEPDEVGGGVVSAVDTLAHRITDRLPDREEAGTPNILGAIALASSLSTLSSIGMENIWEHEQELAARLISGMRVFSEIWIYGDTDLERTPRAGVVSFNVEGLHRAIVSKALADYFNIAVRSGRFCAYPYVDALLRGSTERGRPEGGMIRASLGIYTTAEDVQRLHQALNWIIDHRERLLSEYEVDENAVAVRKDGWQIQPESFDVF